MNRRWAALALVTLPAAVLAAGRIGRMDHEPIRESSGLAVGVRDTRVLWTLNDSGNAPLLFAVERSGELLGEVLLAGATNQDWESLAATPDGTLWIGDVGDNARLRRLVTVYRLAEPRAGRAGEARPERIDLEYPDGPHDCEAMVVANGVIYLVTKTEAGSGCAVYAAANLRAGGLHRLTQRLRLKVDDAITGADLTPDGRRLVLAGYDRLYVYAGADGPLALLRRPPRCYVYPFDEQFEAAAFDGYDLLLTSEQRSIYRIPARDYERAPLAPAAAARSISGPRLASGARMSSR